MAAISTININGAVTGLQSGTKQVLGQIVNASAPGEILDIALVNGDNTIMVPTGAVGCLITPPTGNTIPLAMGAGADTGKTPMHLTNPYEKSFGSGVTQFVINVTGSMSGTTQFNYF